MKPRILISPSVGHAENYIRAVEKAGGEPVAIHSPTEFEGYDGLLLAGGEDISPELYGEVNEGLSVGMDKAREASDPLAVDAFIKAGKPILGICRGMQALNVIFGGTMIQHLNEKCAVHTPENGVDKFHTVKIESGSIIHTLYGEETEVTSSHHQAVKDIADAFVVTAAAPDGTVEAIEHKTLNIVGVQWHPERYDCGAKLIEWFVGVCELSEEVTVKK
ncbi:MAG: gamma-glutamyl-gamma-aminobutyrate hydrolase family protein [Oscillospiraceae bacterium]|nr:gamma-glutamyl-gamma-aminobutyrate hydrolase family protein [Oscillospiraceae bacterium]